jgi:hypothetical protein
MIAMIDSKKTHTDGIWVSLPREIHIVEQFSRAILEQGWTVVQQDSNAVLRQYSNNYGHPYVYQRGQQQLHCRFVDSVFMPDPSAWRAESTVISDNIPLRRMSGTMLSVIPEFWHMWKFDPMYTDRPATWAYNCFMNKPRGDRSVVFYELIRRNLLDKGLVSYNVDPPEYTEQFEQLQLDKYANEHELGRGLIPYNNLVHDLEQCIIDSNVSLVLETYTSDDHAVFSEKIFRCLQMPRPWLLYCSPGSVALLKNHGFDVLDDYVDISYDDIVVHGDRLQAILDQLETFVPHEFTSQQMMRFKQASQHNQKLLQQFQQDWPMKFQKVLSDIKSL